MMSFSILETLVVPETGDPGKRPEEDADAATLFAGLLKLLSEPDSDVEALVSEAMVSLEGQCAGMNVINDPGLNTEGTPSAKTAGDPSLNGSMGAPQGAVPIVKTAPAASAAMPASEVQEPTIPRMEGVRSNDSGQAASQAAPEAAQPAPEKNAASSAAIPAPPQPSKTAANDSVPLTAQRTDGPPPEAVPVAKPASVPLPEPPLFDSAKPLRAFGSEPPGPPSVAEILPGKAPPPTESFRSLSQMQPNVGLEPSGVTSFLNRRKSHPSTTVFSKTAVRTDAEEAVNSAGHRMPETGSAPPAGQAPLMPSLTTAARVSDIEALIETLNRRVQSMPRQGSGTVRLTVQSGRLGPLTVLCRENGAGLQIEIQASSRWVQGLLQRQEGAIREMLQMNGTHVGQFDVTSGGGQGGSAWQSPDSAEDGFFFGAEGTGIGTASSETEDESSAVPRTDGRAQGTVSILA